MEPVLQPRRAPSATSRSRAIPPARSRRRARALATVLAAALAFGLSAVPARAGAGVVERPVAFAVENRNDSLLPCPVDGGSYVVRGTLVAAPEVLAGGPASVALYLHGASQGELVWREPADERLDFARDMARRGHVSVAIDRLGYDRSGHPPGQQSCFGGEATVVRQVIAQLRAGSYRTGDGVPSRGFGRVALVGFSMGGAVAQVAAYSFQPADALAVLGWADGSPSFASGTTLREAPRVAQTCLTGGEHAEGPGTPAGYVFGWGTAQDAERDLFHNVEPAVVRAHLERFNRDPCGLYGAFAHVQAANAALVSRVAVPVLLGFGEHDALFPAEDRERQRARFSGSSDVTLTTFPESGHVFMASRSAATAREEISGWLAARGF